MRVLKTKTAVWVETEEDYAREAPEAYERARQYGRANAFAALPLVANEQALAVLTFSYGGPHHFSAEDKAFLRALVHASAQSLERARLYIVEAEARQMAETTNRRKDEFLAMLGHELRNPLAAMTNALELLRLRQPPGRELGILDRHLGRLSHIVDELLDVSRITQGKITLERTPVRLDEVIATALETVRPLLDERTHELTLSVASDLVIDGDPERLAQIISNVVENAARYTPPNGRIEVVGARDADRVQLIVRDNGRGIPRELMPHIFEWFVQGEHTIDRRDGGLGVGLTLVKVLTELHGGTVTAASDGEGKGATFTLTWPMLNGAPMQHSFTINAGKSLKPLRVLVVDDNVDAAELLGLIMEDRGHEVSIAFDGESALEKAQSSKPDVVFLDIGLPVLDGFEVARRMREMPECKGTVMIALTGYGQADDRNRTADAGFEHHLVKPVGISTIESLLAKLST